MGRESWRVGEWEEQKQAETRHKIETETETHSLVEIETGENSQASFRCPDAFSRENPDWTNNLIHFKHCNPPTPPPHPHPPPPYFISLINSLDPSDAYINSKLSIIGSENGLSPGRHQAVHFKMSFGKWRSFCLGLNVLNSTSPLIQPPSLSFASRQSKVSFLYYWLKWVFDKYHY